VLLAAAVATAFMLGRHDSRSALQPQATPIPSSSSTPSPSDDTTSQQAPAEVRTRFPGNVNGVRLQFVSYPLGVASSCREGQYRPRSRYLTAYFFSCSDVAGSPFQPYIFYVRLTNRTKRPVTISLSYFVVVTRAGDSQAAVDVRSDAAKPEAFIPPHSVIPPHASLRGWIAFDGRLAFVPTRLSYIDGQQTLTVEFAGARRVT